MTDYRAEDLADDLGVSPSTVGRWEKDERKPKPAAIEALAKLLNVTPAWLHYGVEPMRPFRLVDVEGGVDLPPPTQSGEGSEGKRRPA